MATHRVSFGSDFTFNNGNIGIGETNPISKLEINVGSSLTAFDIQGSEGQLFSVTNNLTSGSIFSVNDVSGIPSIDVDVDGTILLAPYEPTPRVGVGITSPTESLHVFGNILATGTVTQSSDVNIKENIEVIEDAIEKIKLIRGVTYTRSDIGSNARFCGVIAQEVEKVFPEVVSTDESGLKSVAYGNMIAILIQAIKEQQLEIEYLKDKIENNINSEG